MLDRLSSSSSSSREAFTCWPTSDSFRPRERWSQFRLIQGQPELGFCPCVRAGENVWCLYQTEETLGGFHINGGIERDTHGHRTHGKTHTHKLSADEMQHAHVTHTAWTFPPLWAPPTRHTLLLHKKPGAWVNEMEPSLDGTRQHHYYRQADTKK